MTALIDISKLLQESDTAESSGTNAGLLGSKPKDQQGAAVILDICRQLGTGNDVHFFTDGAWSMYELLIALTGLTGQCKAYLATYAMSETSARALSQLREHGIVTELHCLIDNRTDTRSAGSLQLLQSISNSCVLAACHAKVTLLVGKKLSLVLIGSANYTENKRLECGFVTSNTDACNFHQQWILNAINNGQY